MLYTLPDPAVIVPHRKIAEMIRISEPEEFSGGERTKIVLAGSLYDGLYVLICTGYGKFSAAWLWLTRWPRVPRNLG
jgi:hypothetical protein